MPHTRSGIGAPPEMGPLVIAMEAAIWGGVELSRPAAALPLPCAAAARPCCCPLRVCVCAGVRHGVAVRTGWVVVLVRRWLGVRRVVRVPRETQPLVAQRVVVPKRFGFWLHRRLAATAGIATFCRIALRCVAC